MREEKKHDIATDRFCCCGIIVRMSIATTVRHIKAVRIWQVYFSDR